MTFRAERFHWGDDGEFDWHPPVATKDFDPSEPRDELGRWTDGGGGSSGGTIAGGGGPRVIAWHGTIESVVAQIKSEGLHVTQQSHHFDGDVYASERGESVFVTTKATTAIRYASTYAQAQSWKEYKSVAPVVFRLEVPEDEWRKFNEDRLEPESYYTKAIPPEWIEGVYKIGDADTLERIKAAAGMATAYLVIFVGEPKDGEKTWDEGKHPRAPAGSPTGGQFVSDGDGEAVLEIMPLPPPKGLSREEIEQIASDTAGELELDSDKISVEATRETKAYIRGKRFTPAGVYSPSSDHITMYVDGLRGADEAEVAGYVSHEIQHAKTTKVIAAAEQEWDVFNERYPDRSPDSPLSAVLEQEFPIYAKLRPFFTQAAREARENSGPEISPYAALHWESGGQHIVAGSHVGEPFILGAENETLSEVMRRQWEALQEGKPGAVKIPDEWRTFHRAINEVYSDMFQAGRV